MHIREFLDRVSLSHPLFGDDFRYAHTCVNKTFVADMSDMSRYVLSGEACRGSANFMFVALTAEYNAPVVIAFTTFGSLFDELPSVWVPTSATGYSLTMIPPLDVEPRVFSSLLRLPLPILKTSSKGVAQPTLRVRYLDREGLIYELPASGKHRAPMPDRLSGSPETYATFVSYGIDDKHRRHVSAPIHRLPSCFRANVTSVLDMLSIHGAMVSAVTDYDGDQFLTNYVLYNGSHSSLKYADYDGIDPAELSFLFMSRRAVDQLKSSKLDRGTINYVI